MNATVLEQYRTELSGKSAEAILSWALNQFGHKRVALASSLGAEDQVLTAMLAAASPDSRVFTLDTGRLFQETYNTQQETVKKYGLNFEIYAPAAEDVEQMVGQHGPNLFYESIQKRKLCCEVRKIRPLSRALGTVDAWICGLRREQSITRYGVELIDWDAQYGIYKICPLYDWSEERVWDYIEKNQVPYNPLQKLGFRSIGCLPCTRAIGPDDDIRAGRWWWESPEQKECGLHRREAKS
jgi:phosphoadenosine phosphosulfate reductase